MKEAAAATTMKPPVQSPSAGLGGHIQIIYTMPYIAIIKSMPYVSNKHTTEATAGNERDIVD